MRVRLARYVCGFFPRLAAAEREKLWGGGRPFRRFLSGQAASWQPDNGCVEPDRSPIESIAEREGGSPAGRNRACARGSGDRRSWEPGRSLRRLKKPEGTGEGGQRRTGKIYCVHSLEILDHSARRRADC